MLHFIVIDVQVNYPFDPRIGNDTWQADRHVVKSVFSVQHMRGYRQYGMFILQYGCNNTRRQHCNPVIGGALQLDNLRSASLCLFEYFLAVNFNLFVVCQEFIKAFSAYRDYDQIGTCVSPCSPRM